MTPTTPAAREALLTRHCAQQWDTNFRMRAFCERRQRQSVNLNCVAEGGFEPRRRFVRLTVITGCAAVLEEG